eukprot:5095869-Amphidinium_carterae.1
MGCDQKPVSKTSLGPRCLEPNFTEEHSIAHFSVGETADTEQQTKMQAFSLQPGRRAQAAKPWSGSISHLRDSLGAFPAFTKALAKCAWLQHVEGKKPSCLGAAHVAPTDCTCVSTSSKSGPSVSES